MTPRTLARQAPLSMGFSRQEHWGGLPCPPPGELLDPRVEPESPALAGEFFTSEPSGKPLDVLGGKYCLQMQANQFPGIIRGCGDSVSARGGGQMSGHKLDGWVGRN